MEKILDTLGFNRREREVALCLMNSTKPLKSRDISNVQNMPRQTVYSILLGLAKRGLAIQTDKNGVRYYFSNVRELIRYIDLERDRLQKIKSELKGNESYVLKNSKDHSLPSVHFYEGSLGLRKLFESILEEYKKGKSKNFRGWGINFFSHSKTLERYLSYMIRKRATYGVKTQLLIAKGPDGFGITDPSKALGRTVKRMDIEPQYAGIYLVANRVYLFSYKDNIGVMIENQSIVGMIKDIFDDHWKRIG